MGGRTKVAGLGALLCCALAWAAAASAASAGCIPGKPGAVLVSYTRTGGFTGIREQLTVYRSGRAVLLPARGRDPVRLRLSCTSLRSLRLALERARFGTLAKEYAPADPVSDGYVETAAYGGRTVRVLTGGKPPARLTRALDRLRDIAGQRA